MRERDHLGDPGVDGRIILRWFFRKCNVAGIDWNELAHDMDRWRALVNAVINLRVPQNAGNFLTSLEPVSFSRRIVLRGVLLLLLLLLLLLIPEPIFTDSRVISNYYFNIIHVSKERGVMTHVKKNEGRLI